MEYAAHFHVQVEERKDRDAIVPKEKETWQFVRKREGRKHKTGQNDARTGAENASV